MLQVLNVYIQRQLVCSRMDQDYVTDAQIDRDTRTHTATPVGTKESVDYLVWLFCHTDKTAKSELNFYTPTFC